MNTWAANQYGGVQTRRPLPRRAGRPLADRRGHRAAGERATKPEDKGYVNVTTKDVDIICAGINHQTWYIQVRYKGQDWTGRLLEGFEKHPELPQDREGPHRHAAPLRLLLAPSPTATSPSTCPGTASGRRRSRKWIDLSTWINGETGGYLRVCEDRNWFEQDFPKWMQRTMRHIRSIGAPARGRPCGSRS